MQYQTEQKIKTAKRLKELREEKKLSHIELARKLNVKYGISISKDVLINYEVSEEIHSRFEAGYGMNIRYLTDLADYYGVSTDYLLGVSNIKTVEPDIISAVKYSQLSHDALMCLSNMAKNKDGFFELQILSSLIENEFLIDLLSRIRVALISHREFELLYQDKKDEEFKEDMARQNKWEVYKLFDVKFDKMYQDLLEELSIFITDQTENHLDVLKESAEEIINKMLKVLDAHQLISKYDKIKYTRMMEELNRGVKLAQNKKEIEE